MTASRCGRLNPTNLSDLTTPSLIVRASSHNPLSCTIWQLIIRRSFKNDIVAMFIESCNKYGIKPGIYCSASYNYLLNVSAVRFKAFCSFVCWFFYYFHWYRNDHSSIGTDIQQLHHSSWIQQSGEHTAHRVVVVVRPPHRDLVRWRRPSCSRRSLFIIINHS